MNNRNSEVTDGTRTTGKIPAACWDALIERQELFCRRESVARSVGRIVCLLAIATILIALSGCGGGGSGGGVDAAVPEDPVENHKPEYTPYHIHSHTRGRWRQHPRFRPGCPAGPVRWRRCRAMEWQSRGLDQRGGTGNRVFKPLR